MKKLITILLLIFVLSLLIGCGKKEPIKPIIDQEPVPEIAEEADADDIQADIDELASLEDDLDLSELDSLEADLDLI